jgi:hypothetical protein
MPSAAPSLDASMIGIDDCESVGIDADASVPTHARK